MGDILKNASLTSQGVRYKLVIAFSLMSIIPLLVCVYFVSRYFSIMGTLALAETSVVFLIVIVLCWLGMLLAKGIIDSIIDMSIEARLIASGEISRDVSVSSDDEIGSIGHSINTIVSSIRDNINELKGFSAKTSEININIHRRLASLNDLLQIGDLISMSSDIEKIAEIIVGKLAQYSDNGYAAVYLTKDKAGEVELVASNNVINQADVGTPIKVGEDFLGQVLLNRRAVTIDSSFTKPSSENSFRMKSKLENMVILPLTTGRSAMGLLIAGNYTKGFVFSNDDVDMYKIFAKQLILALENQIVRKQTEILSLKDELTGLYNRSYIIARLNEEIERAILYQRPCSLVLIDLDNFKDYGNAKGQLAAENALIKIAGAIKGVLIEPVDKAGRIGDDEFALIFPEKSKRSAIQIAEKLCNTLQSFGLSADPNDKVTASMGVSENPIDGATGAHLMDRAKAAVKKAKIGGMNRVES